MKAVVTIPATRPTKPVKKDKIPRILTDHNNFPMYFCVIDMIISKTPGMSVMIHAIVTKARPTLTPAQLLEETEFEDEDESQL